MSASCPNKVLAITIDLSYLTYSLINVYDTNIAASKPVIIIFSSCGIGSGALACHRCRLSCIF